MKKNQGKVIKFRDIEKRKPENKEHRKEVDRVNRIISKMKTAKTTGEKMNLFQKLPMEIQREMMENLSLIGKEK